MARKTAKKEKITVRFNLEGDLKDRFLKYRHSNEYESNKETAITLIEDGLEVWQSRIVEKIGLIVEKEKPE